MSESNGEMRLDPLTREWVNIVGHRQSRPNLPTEGCPFCPGGLEAPEAYDVRSFPNRWPALGAAEVVLFAPDHDASLATLPVTQVRKVIDMWADRTEALLRRPDVEYVLVFENRGREVGATIDHPHGQIYGYPFVPPVPEKEAQVAREHGCPVCSEAAAELADGSRVVARHGDWLAYVPEAAGYPYGMRFAPLTHAAAFPDLDAAGRDDLAALLIDALGRYDRLFPVPDGGAPFPYLLWFHQAPAAGGAEWHLHAHTAPPLRAAGVARFVASGELGSGTLSNPVVPELAARALRDA
ncbi:MAG: galactose-1-phosphate uridylyltransferase [Actinomycetota bacterium]|nr:galactose-1-phosphate uridylyltransferase [Actinomycetota bacterium]